MTGLRERNRRRTRQELAAAALDLFAEHGVARTTADDIADAVGVSRSTFFRYFPTKEHAVFPDHEEHLAAYRTAVASTPPATTPRAGILAAAEAASSATIEGFRRDPERFRTRQRVVAANPSVRALALRLDREWEALLAEAFARHLPDGPDRQLLAELLAGSLLGIVDAFHRRWAVEEFQRDPAVYREPVMAVFARGVEAAVTAADPA